MAHAVLLTAGDEERLVRVADDVVVADMPDEEAPIGKRELELGREALGAFADRFSRFTNVFDQADGEIEEARAGRRMASIDVGPHLPTRELRHPVPHDGHDSIREFRRSSSSKESDSESAR